MEPKNPHFSQVVPLLLVQGPVPEDPCLRAGSFRPRL